MGATADAAGAADAATAAGETVVVAATPPAAGTFLIVFLLVTMIDVNSMLEMVESEVWLWRCEFDGCGDGVRGGGRRRLEVRCLQGW